MFRFISIISRKIKFNKSEAKILNQFIDWKKKLDTLPEHTSLPKLLIIRLDDIGDYIVFRNFLHAYRLSSRWKNYEITFLGNIVWKELFEMADINLIDKCIWLHKHKYLTEENYRINIWMDLRKQGFEIVVCTSRTRLLLLDDLCTIASGAKNKISSANTTFHTSWNKPSDGIYTELFHVPDETIHEFYFNKLFAEWCCKVSLDAVKLYLPYTSKPSERYIVCFIGVSTKSRQWPMQYWIEFIHAAMKKYSYRILITGSKEDERMANAIASVTGAENIAGKTTLSEMVNIIGNAALVITNDTMAVHIGAACNTKTIILSNGNNFYRFVEYKKTGFKHVFTLYSKPFSKALRTKKFSYLKKYIAVTKDIHSIKPISVLNLMNKIIND